MMQYEITNERLWWEVKGSQGTVWYDAQYFTKSEVVEDYGDKIWSIEKRSGYGARLSDIGNGYLEGYTPWTVFDTEEEAMDYLESLP
jgi:hypothetical protein